MLWNPIFVVAAVGSVSLQLVIMSNYAGSGSSDKPAARPVVQQAAAKKGKPITIPVGVLAASLNGPKVKVAQETFLQFPDETRIVANTATKNLMIIDLSIPMGRSDLIVALREAVSKTSLDQKLEEKQSNQSIQLEFWSRDGSAQIVLDEISEDKTSASIRVYGDNLFARK